MPDFHPEGIRTYLTSYKLPADPTLDVTNDWTRNPRDAPPYALHETPRIDKHIPFLVACSGDIDGDDAGDSDDVDDEEVNGEFEVENHMDVDIDNDNDNAIASDSVNGDGNGSTNGSGSINENDSSSIRNGDETNEDDATDSILLPCYDGNRLPIKYVTVTADPGAPLQLHFMVWSQQVIHDMELPRSEPDEFMDIRVEVSISGRGVVDVGYISYKSIKPNGLPVGIEFCGQRCGDAKESPLFFTSPPLFKTPTPPPAPPKNKRRSKANANANGNSAVNAPLEETYINVLVTLGRIGNFIFYDKTKRMSKMVRTAPFHGKYESSTLADRFNGYVWRKEHQNLIRERAINPRTKLFEWRRRWVMNDGYRLRLQQDAYDRCASEWAELEAEAEEYAARNRVEVADAHVDTGVDGDGDVSGEVETPMPKAKRVKLTVEESSSALTPASSGIPTPVGSESPYSFRHVRRSVDANISAVQSPITIVDSPMTPATPAADQPPSTVRPSTRNTSRSVSNTVAAATTPPVITVTTPKPARPSQATPKPQTYTDEVRRGDAQQAARTNVTFGALPFKTPRQYYREFVPYVDLCRVEYQIVNPD